MRARLRLNELPRIGDARRFRIELDFANYSLCQDFFANDGDSGHEIAEAARRALARLAKDAEFWESLPDQDRADKLVSLGISYRQEAKDGNATG